MFIKKAKFKKIEERLSGLEGENVLLAKEIDRLSERVVQAEQDVGFFKTVIDSIKSEMKELSKAGVAVESTEDTEKIPTINQIINEWLNGKESV